jgi:hypothetical protein
LRTPEVEGQEEEFLRVRHIPPVLAQALKELPALLHDEAPGIRERVAPVNYEDEEHEEEWQRLACPELKHLFSSARALVLEDLGSLRRESKFSRSWSLTIPAAHLQAWLSALGAARVAMGDHHELSAAEMEAELPAVLTNERERAVLLIHLLGWMQGMLLDAA